MRRALIFANGDVQDGAMVRRAIEDNKNSIVVAADGGSRIAHHFNLPIHTIIGDMDSVSSDMLNALVVEGTQVRRFPPEKDFTDLELALTYVVEELNIRSISIVGGLGGRIDQTLANIYLLSLPILSTCDVYMVAGKQSLRLLTSGQYVISGASGDTISLIPIGGSVKGIYTENLYYPLRNETLYFGPARGISNVMEDEKASISIREGMLLLIHTIGQA